MYGRAGLTLLALDDGLGFDLAAGGRADAATGSGLRRMAEEARSVRGTFSAESVPGWGTVIRAHVPYGEQPAPPDRGVTGPAVPLTPREREVLGLLAQGLTDQQIADALAISVRTAEKHVGGVLHKLDARNPDRGGGSRPGARLGSALTVGTGRGRTFPTAPAWGFPPMRGRAAPSSP